MSTERLYNLGDGARVSSQRPWWLGGPPADAEEGVPPADAEPEPEKTEREIFYDLNAEGAGCPSALCKTPYVEFDAHKTAYPYIEGGTPSQKANNMANLRRWCLECEDSEEVDGPPDMGRRGGGHHNFTVKAKRKKSSKKKRRKSSKTKRRKSSKKKRRKSSKTKRRKSS